MRIGLVGVGRIGASHAKVLRDHPDVTDVVLADVDADRAAQVAAELGVRAVAAPEDAYVDVDAVVIAAATSAHAELIVAAAQAGLPVFCEKPVAPDIAGTVRVRDEVERAGIPNQIGFMRRFDAGYTAAREALRSGKLGELRRVHMVTADAEPPPAGYVPHSGGIFRDCHVHDFDILRWVTDRDVVEVYAIGANRGASYFGEANDVDQSAAVLTLDDGTLATVQGSRYNGGGYDVRMEVAGTEATYAVGLDDNTALTSAEPDVNFPGGTPYREFWSRFLPAYEAEINAFIDVARGTLPSPCTVADALEGFYISEAATRSRLEHRPVRLEEVRAA
ncbi:Gfo/Idh/MocA family protein [Phytoactinopolyspora halotolerans]|uniref:Gfo/Idh/MocA family oxidoreductase n=1 Tax=Phytoactinopolyspora halotolerans TaxID=1981512 RepID=A0A6L9SFP9_9ACTN|nr:Gfo/Idh/MocA family oxidoreductase [Phytoactinopolyspora halotolerans]NEE03458.1 Gfo/Idh/MocA family oxidoreductase [Phytoactinopolyspora halotolerans]